MEEEEEGTKRRLEKRVLCAWERWNREKEKKMRGRLSNGSRRCIIENKYLQAVKKQRDEKSRLMEEVGEVMLRN